MPFDPQFAINTLYPAANAAYQIMTVPNPALPPDYALSGKIIADPQQVAPALLAAATAPAHRMLNAMLADSNIFGLVAWNATTKTVIVSFRGTSDFKDWLDDFDAVTLPFGAVPGFGFVHMGFQLVYEHVRSSVATLLAGCAGIARIIVTGHSLGGALATLSTVDIAKNDVPVVNKSYREMWTFAGPRTGAPDFAGNFNKLIPTCYRIVNFMDVVPQLPTPPLFEHVGTEVLVHGGFKPFDVTYAHHLTTYLAGLQKLP